LICLASIIKNRTKAIGAILILFRYHPLGANDIYPHLNYTD